MNPSSPTGASKTALTSGAPRYTGGAEKRSTPGPVARGDAVSAPLSMNVTSSPVISSTILFGSNAALWDREGANCESQDVSRRIRRHAASCARGRARGRCQSARRRQCSPTQTRTARYAGHASGDAVEFPASLNSTAGVSGACAAATANAHSLSLHPRAHDEHGLEDFTPSGGRHGRPPAGTPSAGARARPRPARARRAFVAGVTCPSVGLDR